MDERTALAWLAYAAGRRRARALLAEASSATSAVLQLDSAPLELARFREALERTPHRLLIQGDPHFPALLAQIPDAPLTLYVAGDIELLSLPGIAVVGARRCTRTAAEIAREFGTELAALGLVVVSGLAFGVDAAAHRGALETGRTVGVLGSGIGNVHPASNRPLAAQILQSGGALVSEYPPHQGARPHHFPERNRIISGLAAGVLVVEAGERSGSLITARMALEQGREVMAIPGSIRNPAARGCHRLLRDGAALIETVADVLAVLGIEVPAFALRQPGETVAATTPDDPLLARVLAELSVDLTGFDDLCARTGMSVESVTVAVTQLELGGFVEQVAGGYIRRLSGKP
jgi:DNA processing protein